MSMCTQAIRAESRYGPVHKDQSRDWRGSPQKVTPENYDYIIQSSQSGFGCFLT